VLVHLPTTLLNRERRDVYSVAMYTILEPLLNIVERGNVCMVVDIKSPPSLGGDKHVESIIQNLDCVLFDPPTIPLYPHARLQQLIGLACRAKEWVAYCDDVIEGHQQDTR